MTAQTVIKIFHFIYVFFAELKQDRILRLFRNIFFGIL